jgi:hypothetical protein
MKILIFFLFLHGIHSFTPSYIGEIAVEVIRSLLPEWTYEGYGIPHEEMTAQGVKYVYPIHFPDVKLITTPMVKARQKI